MNNESGLCSSCLREYNNLITYKCRAEFKLDVKNLIKKNKEEKIGIKIKTISLEKVHINISDVEWIFKSNISHKSLTKYIQYINDRDYLDLHILYESLKLINDYNQERDNPFVINR
jgi:hypothetical protein